MISGKPSDAASRPDSAPSRRAQGLPQPPYLEAPRVIWTKGADRAIVVESRRRFDVTPGKPPAEFVISSANCRQLRLRHLVTIRVPHSTANAVSGLPSQVAPPSRERERPKAKQTRAPHPATVPRTWADYQSPTDPYRHTGIVPRHLPLFDLKCVGRLPNCAVRSPAGKPARRGGGKCSWRSG